MAGRKSNQQNEVNLEELGITEFTSPDGSAIYRTGDGRFFTTVDEAVAYLNANQVEVLVNQFINDVGNNLEIYLGEPKTGKLPASDRALLAMQTRLKNNVTLFAKWYLYGHDQVAVEALAKRKNAPAPAA